MQQICFKSKDKKEKTLSFDFFILEEQNEAAPKQNKKTSRLEEMENLRKQNEEKSIEVFRKFGRTLKSILRSTSFQETRTNSHEYFSLLEN